MKITIAIIFALIALAATSGNADARGCPIQNNGWCIFIEPGP